MSKKNRESKWTHDSKVAEPSMEYKSIPEKIDFDSWWSLVSDKVPAMHHKEIIKADMSSRGLTDLETSEDFDMALKKYGIELK